jgi:hypothetical protein
MAEIILDKGKYIVDLSAEKKAEIVKGGTKGEELEVISAKIKQEFDTEEEAKEYMKKIHFQGAYMAVLKARTQ